MSEDTYKFDSFDDGSERLVGKKQAEKLRHFMEEYEDQLLDIHAAMRDDTVPLSEDSSMAYVWDPLSNPVSLSLTPFEPLSLIQLTQTEDKSFSQDLLVFTSLCAEIERLVEQAEKQFYGPIFLYGENGVDASFEPGEIELMIGRLLDFVDELRCFTQHVNAVVLNVIRQLSVVYPVSGKGGTKHNFKDAHVGIIYEKLGQLLAVLLTLDTLIGSNMTLKEHWLQYRRMLKSIRAEPQRFGVEEDKVARFEKRLLENEGFVLDGCCFKNCYQQAFDIPGRLDVRNNRFFLNELFTNFKSYFLFLNEKIGSVRECGQRYELPGCYALYVLFFQLSRDHPDKKLLKTMFEVHKRIPCVTLWGNALWLPGDFLVDNLPYLERVLPDVTSMENARVSFLKQQEAILSKDVARLFQETSAWMVHMESSVTAKKNKDGAQTALDYTVFTQGLTLASRVADIVKESLNLHVFMSAAMRVALIRSLCQCLELIKAVELTYFRSAPRLTAFVTNSVQQTAYALSRSFLPLKSRLESGKKANDSKSKGLHAINLFLKLLSGGVSRQRLILMKICAAFIIRMGVIKDSEVEELKEVLRKLDMVVGLQGLISSICDCSFLYPHRILLQSYFNEVYQAPQTAHKLQYLLGALGDCEALVRQAKHLENPTALFDALKKEVNAALNERIVQPLCRDIETDLRLHIHSHLDVDTREPFKDGLKDLARFLTIKPLKVFGDVLDLKAKVTHYLDSTFYNLTTVALHDWKTYEEMRNLALQKYNLKMTEVHLPGATLDQGLDVLEIMRNIHVFVSQFSYNLNNQIFVEHNSDSKFLNTINIVHIANSIRTHGTGIMNTTVNFTYQFLVRKLHVLSQFLFDDHIKSRLLKDMRFFREKKDELHNCYPFERAFKFHKEIRKLGVMDGNQTYLDKFRSLITEIGNAMGFIRMIRSGGIHHIANAIKFVPNLQKIVNFEELVSREKLSAETVDAAKNADTVLENLATTFSDGSEYFKLLVDAFKDELRSAANLHLRNFPIIVPPLTVNFVEHMLINKDMLAKKGRVGLFTDDGFVLGVAFVLKLLDQYTLFDSLHWFDTVKEKLNKDLEATRTELNSLKKNKKDSTQAASATLTIQKLSQQLREYELLYFSFSSARIFFRDI
eukprot:GCRY01004171.1.p1 GENE.GCRY01004171.1~~GCRY01004171.1.p1  ORF type:complete len:1139 (-),score=210.05 GCRY01004171.1:215-3631(-)